MKNSLQLIFWGIIILFLTTKCSSPNESNSNNTKLSYLHVEGHDMVNEQGNKVFIKSIGLGNWILPEGYMWKFGEDGDRPRKIEKVVSDLIGQEAADEFWQEFRANYITESDIIQIKELGFNAVRPALNARLFLTEEDNPVFIDEGFILLENLIQWCKKHEIYVIIDMHGAPGGQTGQNIDDSPNDLPELFLESKHQDALVKLWVEIATRYKDEPTVAAYDLLNEPLPAYTGWAAEYGHLVEPLYKRLTEEIRKIDTKHMITLEGVNWSNDWSIFGKPFDDNTFYQFHYYCWNNPTQLNDISYFTKHRDTLNTPIWVGETGEKDVTIYWATMQNFEVENIGWSFWPWKKMDTKNTPYSINKPIGWDSIAQYTRKGPKPSRDLAEKAFAELLENIKLENCIHFEDVTNALFTKIPATIQAENYLQGKYKDTYFVKDTSKTSTSYRLEEFVPIEIISKDTTNSRKWRTEQAIVLQTDEWVTFQFNSDKKAKYKASMRAYINGTVQLSTKNVEIELDLKMNDWETIDLKEFPVGKGNTKLTFKVTEGSAKVDWLKFK